MWDESDMHAASSMISPTQRLALEALQSIDNLATYLDCATKLVLTMFHFFLVLQTIVSSLVELTNLEISGLQEDLGGWVLETITLSYQGAIVLDECRFHFGRLFVF